MSRENRAGPDWTCVCGRPLGHREWRACFPRWGATVCEPCQTGNHLACRNNPCPCVHLSTKPRKGQS